MFCVAYYGTVAVEGLASPGNYYSSFIDHHLDYPNWLRSSLLHGSKLLLSLFGFDTIIPDSFHLKILDGASVQLIYACLGVGVMSFWLAFVVANKGGWVKKIKWVIGGILCIWLINITRIGLVLVANNKGQRTLFGLDNHTFFNICSYVAIFVLIYFYDRNLKKINKVAKINSNNS